MAQIHTFEFMQAEVNDLKAEIERLTKWNHDRLEELKERETEIERLRDDAKSYLSDYYEQQAINQKMQAALVRIGILNASGGHYDAEIDRAIREVNEQKVISVSTPGGAGMICPTDD